MQASSQSLGGVADPASNNANTASISAKQLRAAFENGSPRVVYDCLQPYLSIESRTSGDAQTINEISQSVSKLLYPWFQNSEAMRSDEQRSMYILLRPDGLLVDTLLQYHVLRQQQRTPAQYTLSIDAQSLPVEFQNSKGVGLPSELAKRAALGSSVKAPGFGVDALELYIYHLCKALVPPRENSTDVASRSITYPTGTPGRSSMKHGATVPGSVVHSLAREYTCFFLPVCVPEKQLNANGEIVSESNPMKQIRSRLHDLSPRKSYSGQPSASQTESRKPGTTDVDLLDACEYSQALDLAIYFSSCVTLLWLPVISKDLRSLIRNAVQKGPSDFSSDASGWVWIPSFSHLSALNLFHLVVGYLAKGDRQMERYHLAGTMPEASPVTGGSSSIIGSDSLVAGSNASAQYIEAFEKRIGMSGTIRDTLRSRCLTVPLADTLGLVLASCGRAGVSDTDIWIPFVDVTAAIWIRYIMPWRGSKTTSPGGSAANELSPVWQARIPLMVKGISPVLYGQTLALFLQKISGPNIDLLAHTASVMDSRHGSGVQSRIHGAVESVFGHGHTIDALTVLERVVSAFTGTELRSILAAIERFQIDAFPRLRSQLAADAPTASLLLDPSAVAAENAVTGTPTKTSGAKQQQQQQNQEHQEQSKSNASFEHLVAAAQQHLSPYIAEIVACRSGSQVFDTVMLYTLGNPPVCIVFGRPPALQLLQSTVQALHSAELLAERQLRLIVPERSSDQARSLVSDIFLVFSRVFNAVEADSGSRPWASGSMGRDASGRISGPNETMRARAQSLHEAQSRISTLYSKLAAVFYVSRQDIEDIKTSQDDAMLSLGASSGAVNGSNGFSKRLAARGDPSEWASSAGGANTPDMEHGALTPRGRWELKTGRKKFTAQSLLASPRSSGSPIHMQQARSQMQSPPKWGLHARGQQTSIAGSLESDANAADGSEYDPALLPRGPRAFYEARSYESQWLLTRIIAFNAVANDYYQKLLDYLEASAYPIPASVRAYKLDFRWAAAYQNIRFLALVFVAILVFRFLFF
ncbi:hypothetical protein LPJ64_000405 [Coemansia asiatica]|uniref:Uncharacterized protein n=1 Tax=Coemansia asiatica TaxID=1052880 RepID=A0A9W7XQC8_9FUNG|nr:hypothetical protein LPJ64_000405 [Coemansia asiatica]